LTVLIHVLGLNLSQNPSTGEQENTPTKTCVEDIIIRSKKKKTCEFSWISYSSDQPRSNYSRQNHQRKSRSINYKQATIEEHDGELYACDGQQVGDLHDIQGPEEVEGSLRCSKLSVLSIFSGIDSLR